MYISIHHIFLLLTLFTPLFFTKSIKLFRRICLCIMFQTHLFHIFIEFFCLFLRISLYFMNRRIFISILNRSSQPADQIFDIFLLTCQFMSELLLPVSVPPSYRSSLLQNQFHRFFRHDRFASDHILQKYQTSH